jgi:hypothetical protein
MVTVPPPWRPSRHSVRRSLARKTTLRLLRHGPVDLERAPPLVRRGTASSPAPEWLGVEGNRLSLSSLCTSLFFAISNAFNLIRTTDCRPLPREGKSAAAPPVVQAQSYSNERERKSDLFQRSSDPVRWLRIILSSIIMDATRFQLLIVSRV